jgi:hypothetical protein
MQNKGLSEFVTCFFDKAPENNNEFALQNNILK